VLKKTIITVAVTGSLTTREQNKNTPYTPEEIADATIESYKAGAAVVHLHVREPVSGKPVQDIELFRKTIGLIRSGCDIIINASTGGGPGMSFDERIAIIPALSSDLKWKPEMASLNAGSLNFGILNRKQRAFVLDAVQQNPWTELLNFADTMTQHGVKPEVEIYEAGMIHNATVLYEIGALTKPIHFQFVLGILGGMQSTVENLIFLKNSLPPDSTWSLCAVGLDIFSLGPVAIASGGNIRVGLEDCVHITPGALAESSAEMVTKMARISRDMGREIASPMEARAILSLSA
jgi:3-keto-5-aminohexanoate cleavage enzyme